MQILTAILLKNLAKKLGLKISGTFKNGYKVSIDNNNHITGCNTLYETLTFNVKDLGDEKTYYFLKGCQIANNAEGDALNKHWSASRIIQSRNTYDRITGNRKAESEFKAEWDGIELDDWYLNEDQTIYEVCKDVDFMGNVHHGYNTYQEFIIEEGQKDDKFWADYILNNHQE